MKKNITRIIAGIMAALMILICIYSAFMQTNLIRKEGEEMKKRGCKMNNEEKAVHEFAVKIRKMTDRQIYDFVEEINDKNNIETFIERLESGEAAGIGPATVKKIKEFALNENYISDTNS